MTYMYTFCSWNTVTVKALSMHNSPDESEIEDTKSEKNIDECGLHNKSCSVTILYIVVLQTESVDIIKSENLLVPSFKNSCDYPEDIFELPYGIDTYIKSYPKLSRPQRCRIFHQQ